MACCLDGMSLLPGSREKVPILALSDPGQVPADGRLRRPARSALSGDLGGPATKCSGAFLHCGTGSSGSSLRRRNIRGATRDADPQGVMTRPGDHARCAARCCLRWLAGRRSCRCRGYGARLRLSHPVRQRSTARQSEAEQPPVGIFYNHCGGIGRGKAANPPVRIQRIDIYRNYFGK